MSCFEKSSPILIVSAFPGTNVYAHLREVNSHTKLRILMKHYNEIIWNANLMQQGSFIIVFLARHVSSTYAHQQEHQILSWSIWFSALSFWMGGGLDSRCVGRVYGVCRTATSAPHTRPTQLLSRTPSIQKPGAENHMLQLNIWCSCWWAYILETCRAKNTVIKLPCCIKLAIQTISL